MDVENSALTSEIVINDILYNVKIGNSYFKCSDYIS